MLISNFAGLLCKSGFRIVRNFMLINITPMETNCNNEYFSFAVFPLLRLSPTPADDYSFNLDDNEGVCDLFDVQILNY